MLAEIETLDADELVERLGEWEDAFRSAGVIDLDSTIALVRSGGTSALLIQYGLRLPSRGFEGNVIVITEFGGYSFTSWKSLREDPEWWLAPGDSIVSKEVAEVDDLPMAFDADEWVDTRKDYAFGDTDWMLKVNDDEVQFDLESVTLGYKGTSTLPSGTLIEVGCGGVSMSTGEIGLTVSIDVDGAVWKYQWGYINEYLGRPSGDDLVAEAVGAASLEAGFNEIVSMSSELLDPTQMRVVVDAVLADDINLDTDVVEIDCVGFSGSYDEFVTATGGPT